MIEAAASGAIDYTRARPHDPAWQQYFVVMVRGLRRSRDRDVLRYLSGILTGSAAAAAPESAADLLRSASTTSQRYLQSLLGEDALPEQAEAAALEPHPADVYERVTGIDPDTLTDADFEDVDAGKSGSGPA